MIVEPNAGDRVEDNLNPIGRAYYAFSTLLCTPASLSQEVGLALGAQAGEARIQDIVRPGDSGDSSARPRRPSTWCSKLVRDRMRLTTELTAPASVGYLAGDAARSRHAPATPMTRGSSNADGVRIFWEGYGDGEPTVLLLPTWSIVHSRIGSCRSRISHAIFG